RAFQTERTQIEGLRIDIMAAQQQRADALKRLQDITTLFETYQFRADPAVPELAQIALLDEQEQIARIERALFILEASGAADRVATWQNRVNGLRTSLDAESTKLADAERAVSKAREVQTAAKTVANQISAEQFDTVMPLLQELYRRLRPH